MKDHIIGGLNDFYRQSLRRYAKNNNHPDPLFSLSSRCSLDLATILINAYKAGGKDEMNAVATDMIQDIWPTIDPFEPFLWDDAFHHILSEERILLNGIKGKIYELNNDGLLELWSS